jgi:hypothetical protein
MAKKTPQTSGRIDPRDPGVRWAESQLKPIAKLFTTRQHREIVEALAGTGDMSDRERYEVFSQTIAREINSRGVPPRSNRDAPARSRAGAASRLLTTWRNRISPMP